MNRFVRLFLLATVTVVACNHVNSPDTDTHAHDEEVPELEGQDFTIYSQHLELFAEASPWEEGKPVEINGHFTLIENGHHPLAKTDIRLLVTVEGETLQEVQGEQRIPGIYSFILEPVSPMVARLVFAVSGPVNDTLYQDHFHLGVEHAHSTGAMISDAITFTKEQAWKVRFRVKAVTRMPFSDVIATSGEMLAMPGEKQNIIAKSDGIILFTSRNLVQGSSVNRGDLLFTLSGKGLANNNVAVQFNEAKTRYQLSKSNYERQKALYAERVVSQKQFNEYKSKYITDSVAYFSLSSTVSDEGMDVYAPMTGYLHELNVTEGQFVKTGQVLATLSANRIMLLRADLPQKYFHLLEHISTTTFRPAYASKVYALEELNGRLLAKGASVAENNHYMPVYFEVTNDGSLLEGAYAEFYLKTSPRPGMLVVPVSALIEEQNNFYVYVQISGETYSKRFVTPEASDGQYAVIASGLDEGERIVTEGAMLVKTASINSAPSHGHQH